MIYFFLRKEESKGKSEAPLQEIYDPEQDSNSAELFSSSKKRGLGFT